MILWADLGWAKSRYSSCATLSLSLPPFPWHSQGCPTELSNQRCADFSFPVKGEFMHFTIHWGKKKQSRLIAGLRRRQTVQSTAPGSQCNAQNWVSLSWLSCSREHTQGEVSECFSQAVHLSGNTNFHFNTFEEVDNGFKINAFIYNGHKMQNVLCTSKCLCETVSIKKNMLYIRGWITVLLHVIIHKK